jgi:hypothetical protein
VKSAAQRGLRATFIGLLSLLGVLLVAMPSQAAEIWFSPTEPVWRQAHNWAPNDYMQLFQPNSPWQAAARGVNVFMLAKKFVGEGNEADLRLIISFLQSRNIALAVQGTPLVSTDACGRGVEGYGPADDMLGVANKVRRLGGTIAYVALDEPLYYGHRFTRQGGAPPCQAPITELARQTAAKMAQLHQVFPAAKIADIEPVGGYPGNYLAGDLTEWLAAYQSASGAPFAFVGLDVVKMQPTWQAQFDVATATLRQAGMPIGIIYNGTPQDPTDAAWIADAKNQIRLNESKLGAKPSRAIFQSWTDRPQKILPETAPDSFTSLVKYYVTGN